MAGLWVPAQGRDDGGVSCGSERDIDYRGAPKSLT